MPHQLHARTMQILLCLVSQMLAHLSQRRLLTVVGLPAPHLTLCIHGLCLRLEAKLERADHLQRLHQIGIFGLNALSRLLHSHSCMAFRRYKPRFGFRVGHLCGLTDRAHGYIARWHWKSNPSSFLQMVELQ